MSVTILGHYKESTKLRRSAFVKYMTFLKEPAVKFCKRKTQALEPDLVLPKFETSSASTQLQNDAAGSGFSVEELMFETASGAPLGSLSQMVIRYRMRTKFVIGGNEKIQNHKKKLLQNFGSWFSLYQRNLNEISYYVFAYS